ncbi:MAG: hypothetical protein U0132_08290 [Gemmatimonadaceae bacterium]
MVFSPSPRAEKAWRLAAFLATDSAQTERLSELGQLPAQFEGGGIARFLASLDIPDFALVAPLAATISRAAEKGVEHPLQAWWTTEVEQPVVLEALQRFGRRIAVGNTDNNAESRVRDAAMAAEGTINEQVDPWNAAWTAILRAWPLLSLIILLAGALLVLLGWKSAKRRRAELLAMLLVRAKHHSALHFAGLALQDMSDEPPPILAERLKWFGGNVAQDYGPHIHWITRGVCAEISGVPQLVDLATVVTRSFDGAKAEYRMGWAVEPPQLPLAVLSDLREWAPSRGPHILAMVVQEWLYNSFKEYKELLFYGEQKLEAPQVQVSFSHHGSKGVLHITTPAPVPAEKKAQLSERPTSFHDLRQQARGWGEKQSANGVVFVKRGGGEGLGLIRDLLHYGLGAEAHIEGGGPTTLLVEFQARRTSRAST